MKLTKNKFIALLMMIASFVLLVSTYFWGIKILPEYRDTLENMIPFVMVASLIISYFLIHRD